MKIPGLDDNNVEVESADFADRLPMKPFDSEMVKKELSEFQKDALQLKAIAEIFEITDDESFARAVEMLGQTKSFSTRLKRAAYSFYIEPFNQYKFVLNIQNSIVTILDEAAAIVKRKLDQRAYQKELERREAEKKAREAAEKFQKDLNKEAKKKGIDPIDLPPAPVLPKETAPIKTESGTLRVKLVWGFEIEDIESPEIFKWVLKIAVKDYKKLAEKTLKKVIRGGVHEGIEGVRFHEKVDSSHRIR